MKTFQDPRTGKLWCSVYKEGRKIIRPVVRVTMHDKAGRPYLVEAPELQANEQHVFLLNDCTGIITVRK